MSRLKGAAKRDPLKGLILEYKASRKMNMQKLAETWGVSRATCAKRINQEHTDLWLTEAKELCKKLSIPIDEFRQAVRY